MVKPWQNKGYTLLESLFVLFITVVLLSLSLPIISKTNDTDIKMIINRIVNQQFVAIMEDYPQQYDENGIYVHFNRKGNAKQANTYYFGSYELIVSLATGRVYVKK